MELSVNLKGHTQLHPNSGAVNLCTAKWEIPTYPYKSIVQMGLSDAYLKDLGCTHSHHLQSHLAHYRGCLRTIGHYFGGSSLLLASPTPLLL